MMEIRLKSTYLEPLFVCLCLLTVLGPANGATVVTVREGSEAVLPCFIRPERNIRRDVFDWKKDGQKEVFFYVNGSHYNNGRTGQDEQFKGRVSHFPEQLQSGDASIVIRDTKWSDSGTYTCDYSPRQPNRQTFTIELVVVSAVVRVTEGSEAVLPCFISPKRDITQDVFDWKKDGQKEVFFYVRGSHYNNGREGQDEQFKGRVSHFQDQLKSGDASIKIRDTKLSDSGNYTCYYSPDEPNRQRFYIELVVVTCPKPHIRLLKPIKDWPQLQCEVRGVSPNHKVEVKDSDGNILSAEGTHTESEGSYKIILNTTVTETGNYHCVVTQEDICHHTSDKIFVIIPDPELITESSTGLVVAVVVLSISLLVVVLLVIYIMRRKIQRFICGPQTKTEEDEKGNPDASDKKGLQPESTDGDGNGEPKESDKLELEPLSV